MNGYGLTEQQEADEKKTFPRFQDRQNNRYKQAIPWIRKAADGGIGIASWEMRVWHLENTMGQYDLLAAERWLRKSAEQGYGQAQKLIKIQSSEHFLAVAEVVLNLYKQEYAKLDDWEAYSFVIRDAQFGNDPVYKGILEGSGPNGEFAVWLTCPTKDNQIGCNQ